MALESRNGVPASIRVLHWRRTRRLTFALLSIWLVVTFGPVFFARSLSDLDFFGWSFSYYMAAQGTIVIYVLLVAVYAWRMSALDKMLTEADGNGE